MNVWRCTCLLVTMTAAAAHAQEVPTEARPAEPAINSPIWSGVGLGLSGFIAGAYVGAHSGSGCLSGEDCDIEGAFIGAAIGGTAGMALGVHLGNRSRGNLGLDFLTGAGVWVGGMALGSATHWRGNAATFVLLGIPIVQLIGTVTVERAIGRKEDRNATAHPAVSIIPTRRGGTLLFSVPLPRVR